MLILSILTWVALIVGFVRWGSFTISGRAIRNPLCLVGVALIAIPVLGACFGFAGFASMIIGEIFYFLARLIFFI